MKGAERMSMDEDMEETMFQWICEIRDKVPMFHKS